LKLYSKALPQNNSRAAWYYENDFNLPAVVGFSFTIASHLFTYHYFNPFVLGKIKRVPPFHQRAQQSANRVKYDNDSTKASESMAEITLNLNKAVHTIQKVLIMASK